MAVYKCPTCSKRLNFPNEVGATLIRKCPVCNAVKTFTNDGVTPSTTADADATAEETALVTNHLSSYRGGQVVDYSNIEKMIYATMCEAVAEGQCQDLHQENGDHPSAVSTCRLGSKR